MLEEVNFVTVYAIFKYSAAYNLRELFIKIFNCDPLTWIVFQCVCDLEKVTLSEFLAVND